MVVIVHQGQSRRQIAAGEGCQRSIVDFWMTNSLDAHLRSPFHHVDVGTIIRSKAARTAALDGSAGDDSAGCSPGLAQLWSGGADVLESGEPGLQNRSTESEPIDAMDDVMDVVQLAERKRLLAHPENEAGTGAC